MIYSTINLFCGIGMFLFGMNLMNDSLTEAFGEKMKHVLATATKSKFRSLITGTAVTGIIQSSTAVSVMAVGFAQKGLLSLSRATGIIMGANIGTTVTNLLIAFNFSALSPTLVFIGSMIKLFSKKEKLKYTGEIILGFGLLFFGLDIMSEAFTDLKESPVFLSFIASSSGKTGGILTGTLMTAIIQSSSASVGILQSLYSQGLLSSESAYFIVVGHNIGTVLTAIISAVGKNKTAKQVSVIHLLFNLIGAVAFCLVYELIPIEGFLSSISNLSLRISVFNTLFNIASVILLYPFYDVLITLSEKIVNMKLFSREKQPGNYISKQKNSAHL